MDAHHLEEKMHRALAGAKTKSATTPTLIISNPSLCPVSLCPFKLHFSFYPHLTNQERKQRKREKVNHREKRMKMSREMMAVKESNRTKVRKIGKKINKRQSEKQKFEEYYLMVVAIS